MNFGELQARAVVGGNGHDIEIHPIVGTDPKAKQHIHLIGPADQVQRRQASLARRRPGWVWRSLDLAALPEPIFEHNLPSSILIDDRMYRLAAKAAFEEYARRRQMRPEILLSSEFEEVRQFIIDGAQPATPLARLLWHRQLMNGPLRLPIPLHMVALIGHPNDPILGGFVAFFGLYYYWVCLSRRHFPLAPHDSIVLIHAQAGAIFEPQFRAHVLPVRVPWVEIVRGSADQRAVLKHAGDFAIRKLREARQAPDRPDSDS